MIKQIWLCLNLDILKKFVKVKNIEFWAGGLGFVFSKIKK